MPEFGPETKDISQFPLVNSGMAPDSALIAVVRRLSKAETIEEITHVITQAARALLAADGITFVLREGDLCHYADEQSISPLWKGRRFPMSACISGWCMLNKERVAIADIYQDPRIPHDAYRPTFVNSLAMVPVRQDDPMAALGAYWAAHKEATARELEVLQALADAAALAVANVQLNNALATATHGPARESQPRRWLLRALKGSAGLPEKSPGLPTARVGAAGAQSTNSVSPLYSWLPALRQNSLAAFAFALACIGFSLWARWLVGMVAPDAVPFATIYPAVLVTTLVAGLWPGVFAALVGGLSSWWAFLPPRHSLAVPDAATLTNIVLYLGASGILIAIAEAYTRALVRVRSEEEKRQLLLGELRHRANNTSAVIQSIVSHTLKDNRVQAEELNRRIEALIATNQVLTGSERRTTELSAVILAELNAYGASRVILDGQSAIVTASLAKTLGLVVHELATNAAKYGALLVPDGLVKVSWQISEGNLKIMWTEQNGPPVESTNKEGFGTVFLRRLLEPIGGAFQRTIASSGVVCKITLPYRESGS